MKNIRGVFKNVIKFNIVVVFLLFYSKVFCQKDLTPYVNMWMGVKGSGHCVIGPQVPQGSINPSPDCQFGNTSGYDFTRKIKGFSQTHVSGTGGLSKYGNFLISPHTNLQIIAHDKTDEEARVGYYKVTFADNNITTEITSTHHAACFRISFPESDNSSILVDVGHNIPGDIVTPTMAIKYPGYKSQGYPENGAVSIDSGNQRISGWGQFIGGWSAEPFKIFFTMEFSKPFRRFGTWKDSVFYHGKEEINMEKTLQRIGAFVQYDTKNEEQILVKIAVSMKSIENARQYLKEEIPHWDFEQVLIQNENTWENKLNKILIDGATVEQMKLFYSCLYRAQLMPRDRTGDNPHWESDMPYWDDHYCVWDTWKTLFPLHVLINESLVKDNILAFIDRYQHNGRVLDAFIAGNDRLYTMRSGLYYYGNQGGDNVDNVIADAFMKGVGGINWEEAYKVVENNAERERGASYVVNNRGWMPNAGFKYNCECSRTMEFAYNDFCAGQIAKKLGKRDAYMKYMNRSGNWVGLWNENLESNAYKGFICPRKINGDWLPYNPMNHKIDNIEGWFFERAFYEGNSWIYSYFVPHNFDRLIELCGGNYAFIERLQFALNNDLIDFKNEPSFLTPFSFIYAGRPDLCSYWVRQNINNYNLNGFPGEEDSGAMSSWYIFASMGFFPNAGQDIYLINGPLHPFVKIKRENGAEILIEAENASPENIYVQSATLNGKPLNRAWIRHSEIANGAKIAFIMGNKPSEWGKKVLPPVYK